MIPPPLLSEAGHNDTPPMRIRFGILYDPVLSRPVPALVLGLGYSPALQGTLRVVPLLTAHREPPLPFGGIGPSTTGFVLTSSIDLKTYFFKSSEAALARRALKEQGSGVVPFLTQPAYTRWPVLSRVAQEAWGGTTPQAS